MGRPSKSDKSDDFCDLFPNERWAPIDSPISLVVIFVGFTCKNARFLRLVNTARPCEPCFFTVYKWKYAAKNI